MIVVGDVIRWRGMWGHEGVVVAVGSQGAGQTAAVCYHDNAEELKCNPISELELAEGGIDERMQEFIDNTTTSWLRR